MGVADQLGNQLSLGVEDANPMVAPIGDIDVAIGVNGDIGRMIEMARAGIPRLPEAAATYGPRRSSR